MRIRRLVPDDLPAYRALRLDSMAEAPTAAWATQAEEAAVPLEQIRLRLADTPYQAIFGAFDGERLVAIACFKREAADKVRHRGLVWSVYVAPAARGAGLARRLMDALLAHVRTLPEVIQLNLCVRSTNEAAKALYRSLGFVTTGVDPRSIWVDGAYHDEDRMALMLHPA
jgi:ribosomal protein S18 acetylase RimI-like enzyme